MAWIGLGWQVSPEVSFSYYGERGVIDLLAWHAPTGTLLVVEVKIDIVDAQELLGTLDRKTRLARRVARDRGLAPRVVATWLVVAEGSTNRNRVARFCDLAARFVAGSRSRHGLVLGESIRGHRRHQFLLEPQ